MINDFIKEMRNATLEEIEHINNYIDSISIPTGINIFDIYEREEKMEQLSNSISNVIESIEPLIIELAGALGTTVEFVEENFIFYLTEFGKYQAFIKTPGNLLIGILIAFLFGFGIFLLIGIFADDIPEKAEGIILKGIIDVRTKKYKFYKR